MKAIVAHEWGAPDVLKLEDVQDPVAGPGEVLIGIKAVGINPAETYMRSGVYAYLPPLPCIIGGDSAGVVEAVGDGVTGISVGQRVYTAGAVGGQMTGCYAEKVTRPADQVFALPDRASFAQGAAAGVPFATAHYALFERGSGRAGETVFIHGASGAVGTAAIQLAKGRGLKVIGSAGSQRGLDLISEQGADLAVDHTKDGYLDQVREATGGIGPEMILEMLANVNLENDLDLAAKYGRIMVIGNRGTVEINPRAAMMKELDVRGLALWNVPPDTMRQIHISIVAGLGNGTLNPIIGREMPLAEAAQAHVAVLEPGAYGKIVLVT